MGYSLKEYVVEKDASSNKCKAKGPGAQDGDEDSVQVIIDVPDADAREYEGVIVAPRGAGNEKILEYGGATDGLYCDHSKAGSQPWVKFRNPSNGDSESYEWVLGNDGPPCTLRITIRRT